MSDIDKLFKIKADCVKTLLGLHKKANSGHIGTSLSCLDILICLFFDRMKDEDKFILSKGHAAVALYTVLAKSGRMPESELESFYKDGTLLAAHPPCSRRLEGVSFGTGSLGHGLSLAAGIALSNRFSGRKFNVYCVLSEGDCNEGSTWEAALFAAHQKIFNLVVIIDNNGLQGFGKSDDVLGLEPFVKKWESFNFEVAEASNGNDFNCLVNAFEKVGKGDGVRPKCIIAKTVKGSGVSFMENKMEWHYLPMSDEQYKKALNESGARNA
ncbi:MAG: transketolase [Victivallales bacterium]